MPRIDLPSEPEESGRPEQSSAGVERLSPKSQELPDPDERGRVYEATRAHAEAKAGERPEEVPGSEQQAEQAGQWGYWSEVPRFRQIWADHDARWPKDGQPVATMDGTTDLPGSHRSKGGSDLSPERHAETTDAIGRVRKAEPTISADTQTAEKENTCGGWLEGFKFRLKGDDRLKEKVAEKLEANQISLPAEVVRRFLTRYATLSACSRENYTWSYYDIKHGWRVAGYEMYYWQELLGEILSIKGSTPDG